MDFNTKIGCETASSKGQVLKWFLWISSSDFRVCLSSLPFGGSQFRSSGLGRNANPQGPSTALSTEFFQEFAFDSQAIFGSQTDENRARNYFESAFRSRSASELLLGAFWARFLPLLGGICRSWATSWPSWGALGWPGCPLGRPWAVLGRSEIATNLEKTPPKLQNGLPVSPWVAKGAFLNDF